MNVSENAAIEAVAAGIQISEGFELLRLVFAGRELQVYRTLSEYGIQTSYTLYLELSLESSRAASAG